MLDTLQLIHSRGCSPLPTSKQKTLEQAGKPAPVKGTSCTYYSRQAKQG